MGIPNLYKVFFREMESLKAISAAVFKKCKKGDNPLYTKKGDWRDWPKSVKKYKVLKWFNKLIILFLDFVKEYRFILKA